MPKWLRFSLIGTAVLFGALQLVPIRVSNPSLRREPPWDSPRTRQLAVAACFNCHSNETRVAWFERIAPVSWWIAGHVEDGRDELNFSEYDANRHESGEEIAEPVVEGEMPPGYYTWFGLHSEAKLSSAERDELVKGLQATFGPAVGVDDDGDSGRGRGRGRGRGGG